MPAHQYTRVDSRYHFQTDRKGSYSLFTDMESDASFSTQDSAKTTERSAEEEITILRGEEGRSVKEETLTSQGRDEESVKEMNVVTHADHIETAGLSKEKQTGWKSFDSQYISNDVNISLCENDWPLLCDVYRKKSDMPKNKDLKKTHCTKKSVKKKNKKRAVIIGWAGYNKRSTESLKRHDKHKDLLKVVGNKEKKNAETGDNPELTVDEGRNAGIDNVKENDNDDDNNNDDNDDDDNDDDNDGDNDNDNHDDDGNDDDVDGYIDMFRFTILRVYDNSMIYFMTYDDYCGPEGLYGDMCDDEMNMSRYEECLTGKVLDFLEPFSGLRACKRLRKNKHKWKTQKAHIQIRTKHCTSIKNCSRGKKLFVHFRVNKLMALKSERQAELIKRRRPRTHKKAQVTRNIRCGYIINENYTPAPVRYTYNYSQNHHHHHRAAPVRPTHTLTAYNADRDLDARLVNLLITMQDRDLTPEDYELLLQLDERVAPKTVAEEKLLSFRTDTVTESEVDLMCSICMEHYRIGQTKKHLPCGHFYHSLCIDNWLKHSSMNCPLDGLALE